MTKNESKYSLRKRNKGPIVTLKQYAVGVIKYNDPTIELSAEEIEELATEIVERKRSRTEQCTKDESPKKKKQSKKKEECTEKKTKNNENSYEFLKEFNTEEVKYITSSDNFFGISSDDENEEALLDPEKEYTRCVVCNTLKSVKYWLNISPKNIERYEKAHGKKFPFGPVCVACYLKTRALETAKKDIYCEICKKDSRTVPMGIYRINEANLQDFKEYTKNSNLKCGPICMYCYSMYKNRRYKDNTKRKNVVCVVCGKSANEAIMMGHVNERNIDLFTSVFKKEIKFGPTCIFCHRQRFSNHPCSICNGHHKYIKKIRKKRHKLLEKFFKKKIGKYMCMTCENYFNRCRARLRKIK